ncbi:D-glutamate cyclase [Balamuthia mandrillaris]
MSDEEDKRSAAVASRIASLERIISADPGNRGIGPLVMEGELMRAARAAFRAKSVAIVTGFYILACHSPETDGPLGALAIARALVGLGKEVTLVTDKWGKAIMEAAIAKAGFSAAAEDRMKPLLIFPESLEEGQSWEDVAGQILEQHKFDHLIAIERVGAAKDGLYHNMRGLDISAYTAPIDHLFQQAYALSKSNQDSAATVITTTGIGDGGNEIGMGKVMSLVERHVPRGETIACATATDNLIVTGVSNWGGYALAAALALFHREETADEEGAQQPLLTTREEESELLDAVLAAGAVDGPLMKSVRSVDGLPFEEYVKILERIWEVLLQ